MRVISREEVRGQLGLPPEPANPMEGLLAGEALEMYRQSIPPPKRYFVIDGSARLYLEVDGSGPREHFAEEMYRSWQRVGDDQRALVEFWKAAGGERPVIELDQGLSLVGRYDADAILFGFNAEAMECAVNDGVLDLVIG